MRETGLGSSDPDPEPEQVPRTKGEMKRHHIVLAIKNYTHQYNDYPQLQDIQQITGLRSFNTLTRQLTILKKEGIIEWDRISESVKLIDENNKQYT